MARDAELRAHITAKDDASRVLDKVADAAEDLESRPVEVEVDADVGSALSELDKLTQEAHATAVAAEELGRALGPELAGKSNLTGLVGDLKAMGVTIEQVTANADTFAASLKDAADADVGGKLGANLGTARGKAEELSDASNKARNSLANMIGNSAQDLGAFGGIAGSTGVALGQLAEGASDAALGGQKLSSALADTAKVAGPVAGLAIAMELLGQAMAAAQASRAFDSANVEQYVDAIEEGTTATRSFNDEIRETNELQYRAAHGGGLLGMFSSTKDLLPILEKVNGSLDVFTQIVDEYVAAGDGSADANDRWRAALEDMGYSVTDAIAIVKAANQEADARVAANEKVTRTEEVLGDEIAMTAEETEALQKLTDTLARAQEEAAAAAAQMAAAVTDARLAMEDGEANSEAFATALDKLNRASSLDFAQMAQDTVGSFDQLKGALDGIEDQADIDWSSFDITPDEYDELAGMPDTLRAVTDAVAGMRGSIQTELQHAFDTGGIDAYTAKAEFFRDQVLAQYPAKFEAMGASQEEAAAQTQALLDDLGLLPTDVEIQVRLTREEEARNALDAFSSVIDQMPDAVQVAINTAIAQGDIDLALGILNDQLIKRGYDPIVLPIDADVEPAQDTVSGFARGDQPSTTVEVEAETKPAEQTVDRFTDEKRTTDPVGVDADTKAAIGTMVYLKILAALLAPQVTVTANTGPAHDSIQDLGRLRPRVPVEAYLADYPTASEIVQRIGRPRIPVDIVVGSSIRITGVRE